MVSHVAVVVAMLALIVPAKPDELKQNIASITANVKIGETIEVTKLDEPVFRNDICNFAITQTSSNPPSVILSGKVVSNNTGGAQELVPLFFGSTVHHPRLAALTNVDGEFRFRVWLIDKPNGKLGDRRHVEQPHGEMVQVLQATDIRDSTLYLNGKFDTNGKMVSSFTHIHSLREFLKMSVKKKP